jgi:prevent-host-death family protein
VRAAVGGHGPFRGLDAPLAPDNSIRPKPSPIEVLRADYARRVPSGRERGVAIMTIYSHNMVMKQVRIADLKARLSEYLRAVRRGETIAVLDRDTPVAQIVPIRDRPLLRVRKPASDAPPPNRVRLPKAAKLSIDIVEVLLEERQGHR